ncbi:MAG: Rrf2 family transcriptional regulator [Alphaproteobacteria bacterium]|nr:Rrf2 family transcriptional regulator [Alphaproteobacteria bacterium]
MKVGSKGRYAVIAIVDVARHSGSGAVPLADVASRQRISLSYLEQLFAMLRRSGIVTSARGPGGGYRLSRPANETSVREIFEAVDETSAHGVTDTSAQDREGSAVTADLWEELEEHIRQFLDQVSVADVLAGHVRQRPNGSELSRTAEVS